MRSMTYGYIQLQHSPTVPPKGVHFDLLLDTVAGQEYNNWFITPRQSSAVERGWFVSLEPAEFPDVAPAANLGVC